MEQLGSPWEWPQSNVVLTNKETRSSSTSSPPQVDLHAQFEKGNEDLSSIYLQATSKSQNTNLFRGMQVPDIHQKIPKNMSTNSTEMMTLPTDFQQTSPIQGKYMQPSQVETPNIGNFMGNPHNVKQAYWINQTQDGLPRELGIQGTQNPISITSGYNLLGASSNVEDPKTSRQKRKMLWNDDGSPSYRSQGLFGTSDREQSFGGLYNDNMERYTVYDKRYEAIGLPMDPHLRRFNSTTEKGRSLSK